MSFIADGLKIGNSDANGTGTNETGVCIAANRDLIIDFLVFILKSESNSQLV